MLRSALPARTVRLLLLSSLVPLVTTVLLAPCLVIPRVVQASTALLLLLVSPVRPARSIRTRSARSRIVAAVRRAPWALWLPPPPAARAPCALSPCMLNRTTSYCVAHAPWPLDGSRLPSARLAAPSAATAAVNVCSAIKARYAPSAWPATSLTRMQPQRLTRSSADNAQRLRHGFRP